MFVLDANGNRIQVPGFATEIRIAQDGRMTFMADGMETSVTLGVFTFRNVTGLASVGGGRYAETEASGERLVAQDAVVRQGVLEGSNVDLAEEMTRMIRTQRAFQLASRALTTADEMEAIANNMRR
jgi:flagellar basal-body rod protein FlgG